MSKLPVKSSTAKLPAGGKDGKGASPAEPNNSLNVHQGKDETAGFATARAILAPHFRHALTVSQINKSQFGGIAEAPGLGDYSDAIRAKGDMAAEGNLAFASRMLAAQAVTLDNIFAEMARRMALHMGEFLEPTEAYARIAMKAQAQSRAALEALAKLHQPREQTVRHVHVNEGGQAVFADTINQTREGGANENTVTQPCGAEAATGGTALPRPDETRDGVPIPSDAERPMSHSRRAKSRRSSRKPKCLEARPEVG